MLISRKKFDSLLVSNCLSISLIGMSGMGKTYRSWQLTDLGFRHFCCDDLIEERIGGLSSAGTTGVSEWMGQPYSLGYKKRQDEYLRLEQDVIQRLCRELRGNSVIDTTGSVVYLSQDVLSDLCKKTLVVYLSANQSVYDQLFEVYLSDPKPVVWGDCFRRNENESVMDSLKKCYPNLLTFREDKYKELADIELPFDVARSGSRTHEFLEEIRERLRE